MELRKISSLRSIFNPCRILKAPLNVLFIFMALSVSSLSAGDNIRYWVDAQFEAHLTSRLKFKGEQELWYDDDRLYMEETIFLLELDILDWLSLAAGDRLVDEKVFEDGKRRWHYEHRPTIDLTLKHSFKGFKFDMRNRLEYRDKEGADKNYLRYRGRFHVRTPWQWTEWKLSPYASWEMYIEDKPGLGKGEMFNRSRSLVGLSMRPTEYLQVSLFYLLQHSRHDDSGWEPVHVPGIEFKFEF